MFRLRFLLACFWLCVGVTSVLADDFGDFVDSAKDKLEANLQLPEYPDLAMARASLIEGMPRVSDETNTIIKFVSLRSQLGKQGKLIENFRKDIIAVCNELDLLDAYIRGPIKSAKLISQLVYEDTVVVLINSMKSDCITDPKDGDYWDLYDEAILELNAATAEIPLAQARCRDLYPETCY